LGPRIAAYWRRQAVRLGREMDGEVFHSYTEIEAITAAL
jgi:hypothetical protein